MSPIVVDNSTTSIPRWRHVASNAARTDVGLGRSHAPLGHVVFTTCTRPLGDAKGRDVLSLGAS